MNRLLEALGAYRAANVFNPWVDSDPLDILPAPAAARRLRLRQHFECLPRFLLVGEAPGYQGCHFSGVPFTNEKLICDGVVPRVTSERFTSRPQPWSEPSATIVWQQLTDLKIAHETVMWNAFAWHPHQPGDPLSNRTPTKTEQLAGGLILRHVLRLFPGAAVIAVGRIAGASLVRCGVGDRRVHAVRHPSMGGAREFRSGLEKIVSCV